MLRFAQRRVLRRGLQLNLVWICLSLACAAAQSVPARPANELAEAAHTAGARGAQAELPPHVSTLLGIARENKCPVKQALLRSQDRVLAFNVVTADPHQIVLFEVNEAAKEQTYYLTSESGVLRREVSVKAGVGRTVKPAKADEEAFTKQKRLWKERLAAHPMGQ